MMKKVVSLFLAAVLVCVCFAGCSKADMIVGSWTYEETTILNVVTKRTYTFNADGSGSAPVLGGITNVAITYTLDKDRLVINKGELIDSVAGAETYTVKFGINTLTLTSEDGKVIELTKVS